MDGQVNVLKSGREGDSSRKINRTHNGGQLDRAIRFTRFLITKRLLTIGSYFRVLESLWILRLDLSLGVMLCAAGEAFLVTIHDRFLRPLECRMVDAIPYDSLYLFIYITVETSYLRLHLNVDSIASNYGL